MKILIIGSGLAGLTGAGRIVRLLDGRKFQIEILGDGSGSSPYVHGFNIPLHRSDSVETFIDDTMKSGYGISRRELVETLCRDSLGLLRDLEELGVELERKDGDYALLKPLGSSWPRVAGSGNHTGPDIMARLLRFLKGRSEVTFTEKARALRLDVRDGRVCGAVLWNRESGRMEYREADCVLLACGGFCGIYPFSTNSSDIGGDGIAMAYTAGASLTDMEFIQFEPSVALFPDGVRGKGMITTMFYEGAALRNAKLERFLPPQENGEPGECVGKDVLARLIWQEIRDGSPTAHGGVYFDATGVGAQRLAESYPSYVQRYRQAGMDIAKEPFEIAPAPHTSLGGVLITPDACTDIEGLFAAGEVTGGIHGANRIGGNAGLETLVFGKRAGQSICTFLKTHGPSPAHADDAQARELLSRAEQKQGERVDAAFLGEYRRRMEDILQICLYLERSESGLCRAVRDLDGMLRQLCRSACPEAAFEKIRLENDLICASLLAHSARARTQSVGCHVRTDSVPEETPCRIVLRMGGDGPELIRERMEE